uniref:Lethal giant larvae homologue 2 domain-containing protein n=1 Tax=Parascaris univalens TaxID=6257 RepID=A0A915BPQ5_PARUN
MLSVLDVSCLMLRFLRSHIHHTGEFKPEDVHNFFKFTPTLRHGFPQNACALAHDYLLGLMAVGTGDGEIRIFGSENIEWYSTTPKNTPVSHMYFALGSGALIVLCSDLSFHKFQLNGDLVERSTANHEERLKRITCCEMENLNEPSDACLLVGTVTGNIFALHVTTLEFSEVVLFEENISKSVASLNGEVKSVDQIVVNPSDTSKLLIAFNCLTVVYYNTITHQVIRYWQLQQPITSIAWSVDAVEFICSHTDGSLDTWSIESDTPVEPSIIPFGPFPCMSISKVRWATAISSPLPIKFYSGGMPRSSYGDRYTLAAMRQGKLVVFDFGSPVIDFFIVPSLQSPKVADFSKAIALVVLCEQEIVCIDLSDRSWPVHNLPYLHSLHSSGVTCNIHCSNIEEHVWKALVKVSDVQKKRSASKNPWPLTAGSNIQPPALCAANNAERRQLLITGHENGMVKIWCAGSVSLRYMLTIDSAKEFEGSFTDDADSEEKDSKRDSTGSADEAESGDDLNAATEWPPFRKVGSYDPFCDDPRLAIQKMLFDISNGRLVVGGRAGHVLVYDIDDEPATVPSAMQILFEVVESSKLSTEVNRMQPLPPRRSPLAYPIGYQPYKTEDGQSCIVQLRPAVAVTALSSLHSRNLLGFGCEYGFVLCDLRTQSTLIRNCLLSAEELLEANTLNGALSRFKSMKKSIRQSFRRKKKNPQGDTSHLSEPGCSSFHNDLDEVKPVERAIVSRSEAPLNVGDPLQSAVRVMKFYHANILSTTSGTDSLWVGTNSGLILVYAIADDATRPEDVCVLVKEIRLQHRAPVIDVDCLTLDGSPIVKGSACAQRLLICTEEQIKTFSLPLMKSTRFKYKLTGIEGSRIRKVQLLTLRSATDRKVYEKFLAVITNQGELFIFSAVALKRLTKANFTKATDVAGIASTVISAYGEIFFLRPGGSEFQRASLAAVQHPYLIPLLKDHQFPPKFI